MQKVLIASMITLSPLFTGEVRTERKKASNVNFPVRKTANNKSLIPFKGPLRAALEILLKNENKQVCDTGRSQARPCGRCELCSLFGSMGKKGRASVDFLISNEANVFEQTSHTRLSREKSSVADSFTAEEIRENTQYTAKIIINDYVEADKEFIKKAIKYIESMGIGGWTNKGYGRVNFSLTDA